jgi:ubiquitin-like modifier-activating enzyme ATG7
MNSEIVRYVPFQSCAEPSFWMKLGEHKLNTVQLSEEPVSVKASYGVQSSVSHRLDQQTSPQVTPVSGRFRLDQDSIENTSSSRGGDGDGDDYVLDRNDVVHAKGMVKILNTIESFKTIDKNDLLNSHCLPGLLKACGTSSGDDIDHDDNAADTDVDALTGFFCLCYLDLKNHKVLYWFAFPSLVPVAGKSPRFSRIREEEEEEEEEDNSFVSSQRTLWEAFGPEGVVNFHQAVLDLRVRLLPIRRGYPPFFIALFGSDRDGCTTTTTTCIELSEFNFSNLTQEEKQNCKFVFLDPTISSNHHNGNGPIPVAVGWPLRNLIAYITLKLGLEGNVDVIAFRPGIVRRIGADSTLDVKDVNKDSSLLMHVELPKKDDYMWSPPQNKFICMGWELNARSKAGPRSVDLAPLLSSAHLSQQATDLNLKLMKWRMIPSLDLEYLSNMKVLLLGAGTLGCSVARTLLGWGVRNIAFVDNGKVSYSNPVRQNLFEVTDCENGGRDKAIAAADALVRIAGSTIQSDGYVLTIPMPGHPFHDKEEDLVRRDTEKIQSLVDESDVIFLLTDTRESRWLPTVMAKASNKPLINAALGLDSWLVMRHGGNKKDRLGCYFCNDVVAPENSTNNRTLDQQCTVTRPGLAPLAASMAVELCISLLHHKEKQDAPAPPPRKDSSSFSPTVHEMSDELVSPLGIMPHQMRGSLVSYTMMTPTVPAFEYCTGCCNNVIETYKRDRFDFVKKVCCNTDGKYLEDISGLSNFRSSANAIMEECVHWEDDDEIELSS